MPDVPDSSICRLEKTRWREFEAYRLSNGRLEAIVVPALGGKIASLRDVKRDREWLWSNPALPPAAPEFGASYVRRFDSGGFDECFPSVAATRYPVGPWEGTPVPDHGEVWALGWEADAYCDAAHLELRMGTHGVRFPYRFERSVLMSANEPSLRLAYRVTNQTGFPFPFLWCAHPVLAVRPGMKLLVPVREMTVYASEDDRFGHLGMVQTWPHVLEASRHREWDLSTLPPEDAGIAVKLFSAAPQAGYVALQDPADGAELRFQFDPTEITHLGLWLNFGGWAGAENAAPYYNLAIEPGIGPTDDLALAVRHYREAGLALPRGKCSWQLELGVK